MPRSVEAQLADLKSRSLLRKLRTVDSPQQAVIRSGGRDLINFSSNDYLGLATEPVLGEAAKKAIDEFGVGAGASRLISGTLLPHVLLEQKLAEFKRTRAALAFSSGYATALGAICALAGKNDIVILDKLGHASLIDGARLSGATVRVFPHNHMGKLESHAKWAREHQPDARILIVTESVFSMDGDRAPLADIVEIKSRYNALLLLDEAHAVGVVGDHGRGLADRLDLTDKVDVQMGTLSKALGASGGYICASQGIIDLLVNRARSFIYSTAPSPMVAAAAAAAVDFLASDAGAARVKQLRDNLTLFAEELPGEFLRSGPPQSAIIPVILGSEETALAASQWLFESGFFVSAIRYPTVAKGAARLRVTVSASHTPEQIRALCSVLAGLRDNLRVA
jgi:glycine C-acetyltransferase/8-amino-7-oxononanoate synthase